MCKWIILGFALIVVSWEEFARYLVGKTSNISQPAQHQPTKKVGWVEWVWQEKKVKKDKFQAKDFGEKDKNETQRGVSIHGRDCADGVILGFA